MKQQLFRLFLFGVALAAAGECGQTPLPAAENDPALEARIDEYVRPYQELGSFSGSILIARGGKILLSKGYGMANYELSVPNTPQTRFHIASLSKPFTAAAILMLEERGRLTVRDPLARFLPDYPNGDRITIHHLLSHRSGIPNVNNLPDYDEKSRFPHTILEIIGMFKHLPAEFAPGERYSYSNSNYVLLAHIIEQASGRSYGDFLAENIFRPLRMANSGHDANPDALLKNRASGYVPAGIHEVANAPYLDWSNKTGNGSLYSTVEDLYKWDRALYTEKILKKATLERMFREGYGWFTGKRLNRRVVRYNGRSPGFISVMSRYVDDDVCIIVAGNNYSALGQELEEPLAAIVFGEKYDPPLRLTPVGLPAGVLGELAGDYQFGPEFFAPNLRMTIVQKAGRLIAVSRGISTPLMAISETEFLDLLNGARIVFQKDAGGQVRRLLYRSGAAYPATKLQADRRTAGP